MTRPADQPAQPAANRFPSACRDLLVAYRDLVLEANRDLNLTAVRDAESFDRRHILESMALAAALETAGRLPAGARVIDVGSGGGLPGIPLAIIRPDLAITLLEATTKKAAFLERAIARLGLGRVRVLAARAEEAAHLPAEREQYNLALARAVAALPALAELTLPFVRVGGALAAVKGSRAAVELAEAEPALARLGGESGQLLLLGDAREETTPRLALIPKVARTPAEFPRRPGTPVKRPLRS